MSRKILSLVLALLLCCLAMPAMAADADVVVMDGSCFEISTNVCHVFIDGVAQPTQVKFCEA